MKDEVALLASVTLLGVLLQGGLAPAREVGGPRTPSSLQALGRVGEGGVVLERPGLGEGQPRLPVLEQRKGCSRAEGLALSPSGKGRGPGGVSVGQTVKLWAGTMAERCLT